MTLDLVFVGWATILVHAASVPIEHNVIKSLRNRIISAPYDLPFKHKQCAVRLRHYSVSRRHLSALPKLYLGDLHRSPIAQDHFKVELQTMELANRFYSSACAG